METKERKIVVAVDESEESRYTLSWCTTNLISHTKNYKLVRFIMSSHLLLLFTLPSTLAAVRERELADSVMERAEAICRKLNTPNNLNMGRVVGSGDAKDVICSTVRKLKPDILVMRSHGCGFFERALPGSVSDHCAKHDTCPVVTVKHS